MKAFEMKTWICRDKKQLFSISFIFFAILTYSSGLLSEANAKGHPDVRLKNEQGTPITPNQNKTDPYSPKKTCGACHGYATITAGYHFQQGFDVVSDRYNKKRSWELSPGMYGRWMPFIAAARLAPKVNRDARQIDLSTYDWIGGGGKVETRHNIKEPSCGWCHPGGGPVEYGRNREGKADVSRSLIDSEALNKESLDGDFSSRFTPDGRSHFRESGVLEADCLLCHLPGYRFEDRNRQISARNYRWAATAGAGFGRIEGAIFQYKNPKARPGDADYFDGVWNFTKKPDVRYQWQDRKKFTVEGKLRGGLVSKTVGTKNCLQCHEPGEAKNTGSSHDARHDIHESKGLHCTDCHPLIGTTARERLRHQIAKGRSLQLTVRDDLDEIGMKTCFGCHYENQYRPTRKDMPSTVKKPQAVHGKAFPKASFHLYLIQCNACHSTMQPKKGMLLLDMSTGVEMGFTAADLAIATRHEDYALPTQAPWKPWMMRTRSRPTDDERYVPCVPKSAQWFGEKMKNGEIRPIPLREIRNAYRQAGGVTEISAADANGAQIKLRTVNTDADIRKMIGVLSSKGFTNVVFVADRVYEISRGNLTSSPVPASEGPKYFAVVHGVGPVHDKSIYGAKAHPDGCMSCHDEKAPFFTKKTIKNMRGFMKDYPALNDPNAKPQMTDWGMEEVPAYE